VHEIGLQRRDHEVADAKAEQVLIADNRNKLHSLRLPL
jgi:hypothetical protein